MSWQWTSADMFTSGEQVPIQIYSLPIILFILISPRCIEDPQICISIQNLSPNPIPSNCHSASLSECLISSEAWHTQNWIPVLCQEAWSFHCTNGDAILPIAQTELFGTIPSFFLFLTHYVQSSRKSSQFDFPNMAGIWVLLPVWSKPTSSVSSSITPVS